MPKTPTPAIRDRIIDTRRVRAGDLIANPKNWRSHPKPQADAMLGILRDVGYTTPLMAVETPDGLMLIDGHLRAETTPDTLVPVSIVDLTPEEADKVLLTHDPLSAMAGADNDLFQSFGWRWYDQRFWKRSQVGLAIWNTTQPHSMSQVEHLFTFQNGRGTFPVHDLSISKEQLWDDTGSSAGMGHPAVMAVGIAEKAITIYSNGGDAIAEPFAGAGTTLIACERLGRRCYAMEIEPRYVDVAVRRWEQFTGREAILAA